jgi:hypothetical protein
MKILGVFSAAALAAIAVVASVETFKSLPDIKRYLKIRSM